MMKERIRGLFAGVRRFFGKTVNVIAVVVVIVVALAWAVGWPAATVYFAHDSGFHRGWTHDLTHRITELRKGLDAAAVENVRLGDERDAYKEAAEELKAYVDYLGQTTMPIGDAFWCTNMPTELIAQDKKSLVLDTANFVAKLSDVDVAPAGVCVDIIGIAGSEVRGELYVPVQRVFSSGAADPLTVVWQVVPGEEGKARPIGYLSWITREWCRLDEATQTFICEGLER